MIVVKHPLIVKSIAWLDEAATQSFAQACADRTAIKHAVIELHGDLGAGKTTFARYLLTALGVEGRIKSPTYTVVETYTLADGASISHFDFYRFNDPLEWEEAGFRDLFASPGLKVIEWPEKAGEYLPPCDLKLVISMQPDETRLVDASAFSPLGAELLE